MPSLGVDFCFLTGMKRRSLRLKICVLLRPSFRPCHEVAAVAYAEMGQLDKARAEAMEAHRLDPEFTLATAPEVLPFKNPEDLQRFVDGLRKAGLPDQ